MEPLSADDPQTIGEFRLHARLGAGGMGQVYLGFSPAGRPVAIKTIHTQFARDPEFLQRFSREVAAASSVSGMYTAPVVGFGLEDSPPWLATAFVPGPPLATVVSRYGSLPEPATWRLAAGLAEALRAVHAAGLVHRDLKPANVLLADDGPHVIDFGISRAFQGTQLTSAGMVIGTPGYMSPEQAEGTVSGPPSDMFSLGCVLAYAATGVPPFGDGSAATILYRVVRSEPDLTAVPPALRQLVEACLKKDAGQRPDPTQLIGMISGLGPATAATLGSFWPEVVSRVIAAEQASATPAGVTPPSAMPAAFAGSGLMPGGQTAGTGGSGGSSGFAAPVPADRTPTALATPPPGPNTGGTTGHAPMISDGYYAAGAAQGRGNPGPATPGPSAPPWSPEPQGYAQPPYSPQPQQTGQAPPGPLNGAPATPYPGYAGQQGPASGYQGSASGYQGSAPGYPGQGPATPYPGQSGGGPAPWPAGGAPGGTGGASALGAAGSPGGDALAQYTAGRRKPMTNEVPAIVRNAIKVMYAGLVVTLVDVVLGVAAIGHYSHDADVARGLDPAVVQRADRMAGVIAIGVIADVLGLACWVWLAVACRRGRGWTRVAGSVVLGIYTIVTLVVAFGTKGDPGARFTTLLVWLLGVAAVIPLWSGQAREFFSAWRKR
ncbi:MAG TPA: protein kinase [Trebonia sp.]